MIRPRLALARVTRACVSQVVLMMQETGMFDGGALRAKHVLDLFEATTFDRPCVADVHSSNIRDEVLLYYSTTLHTTVRLY